MATNDQNERALPKFGEWDVNDPAIAEGYTFIFTKAKDEKKNGGRGSSGSVKYSNNNKHHTSNKNNDNLDYPKKSMWLCCG